jgi:hypothetical protein
VAALGGCSPQANTHAPAACRSALNAATSWYAFCIASGGRGALPSTDCTLSRYCFIGFSFAVDRRFSAFQGGMLSIQALR